MQDNVNNNSQNENIINNGSVDSMSLNNSVPVGDDLTSNVVNNEISSTNVVSMAEMPTTNNMPINITGNTDNTNFSHNSEDYSKKKSKTKMVGIIILIIVILGLVGIFGYKSYIGNSINLYKVAIKKAYEEVSNNLSKMNEVKTFDYKEDTIGINGEFKITSNMLEMKDYTKYKYDFNVGVDVKNKKMELGASMNEGSKEIIAAAIYLLDKTMYIDSKQAYNKILYQVLEQDIFSSLLNEDSNESTVDYEKVDRLVQKLSIYLSDSLNDDYLNKEKATIEVDGKAVKVTKVIYTLNSNSIYEIVKSIIENMKSDDEFIELGAEISETDKEHFKKILEQIEITKEDFEMEEEINFYLYTTGFIPKVIGFGVEGEGTVISYANMGETSEFSLKDTGTEFIIKTIENKSNGSITIDNEQLLTFTLENKITSKNVKFDLSVDMNKNNQKVILDLKTNVIKENDKKANGTFVVNASITQDGATQEIGAELNFDAEIGIEDIAKFNTNGAVNIATLTEQQIQQIGTNLEKALKNTFLYSGMQDTNVRVD